VGEQIDERPGELRILRNDDRSFCRARRFPVRSKSNESSSVETGEASSKFYMYDGPCMSICFLSTESYRSHQSGNSPSSFGTGNPFGCSSD
jgi:hypothetical protein